MQVKAQLEKQNHYNTYIHTHTYTYIYIHTNIHTHIYIYTHIYTCIRGLVQDIRALAEGGPFAVQEPLGNV